MLLLLLLLLLMLLLLLLLRLVVHEQSALSLGHADSGRVTGHTGYGARAQRYHRLHLALFRFTLLLHLVRHFVNAAVQHEQYDECGPEVSDDQRRVEHGILEELYGALARQQVPVADKVFPAEYAGEEQQRRDDPREHDHPHDLVLRPPAPVPSRNLHRTEPVDRDQQHRVLRHQAHRVINGQPKITQQRSQVPVPL